MKLGAFFLYFVNTSKFHGLDLIWVQLPKEFYTKNKYKNIKITK